MKFFSYIIEYANFLPITIYFTLDLIEIIQYKKSILDHTKSRRRHFVQPFNTQSLGNLGLIDYVVMDESALKLQNKLKVKNIYIHKKVYTIRQDDLNIKVLNTLERGSQRSSTEYHDNSFDKSVADEPMERNEIKFRENNENEALLTQQVGLNVGNGATGPRVMINGAVQEMENPEEINLVNSFLPISNKLGILRTRKTQQ